MSQMESPLVHNQEEIVSTITHPFDVFLEGWEGTLFLATLFLLLVMAVCQKYRNRLLVLVKTTQSRIVFTIFRLILNRTQFHSA